MIHPHKLCQLELHSVNVQASIAFFGAVFGWTAVPIAIHEYTVLAVPDDCSFGISIVGHGADGSPASLPPRGVIPYFAVDQDLTEILEKAEKLGGKQLWGPRPIPGYGQLYCLEDPGGIRIGVYARDEKSIPL